MKIRWRISLSLVLGRRSADECKMRRRRHRQLRRRRRRVKPATDSRFARADPKSRFKLVAEFGFESEFELGFSAEHLKAADLISVTRRLGRRRCAVEEERKTCPTHTQSKWVAVAAIAFFFIVIYLLLRLPLLHLLVDRVVFCAVFIALGDGAHSTCCRHIGSLVAATSVKIFEFLMQPQRARAVPTINADESCCCCYSSCSCCCSGLCLLEMVINSWSFLWLYIFLIIKLLHKEDEKKIIVRNLYCLFSLMGILLEVSNF